MTELVITPPARNWVLRHGGVVTVRAVPQHGCCGGHAAVPMAEPRTPDMVEDYERVERDGVTVYLARTLADGPYQVDLEGFWRWRRLVVSGAVSPWRPA